MQKPTILIVAISFFIVTACGRVAENQFAGKMTQDEAIAVLAEVPTSLPSGTSDPEAVSAKGLTELIQDLVASGEVTVPKSSRGAISANGSVDTATLNAVLSALSQGKGVLAVAKSAVSANAGSPTKAKFNLEAVLGILQALAPIIAVVAPQYAGIIQAAIVLIPVIMSFIGMFKKPAPPTASLWLELPQNPGFIAISRC